MTTVLSPLTRLNTLRLFKKNIKATIRFLFVLILKPDMEEENQQRK